MGIRGRGGRLVERVSAKQAAWSAAGIVVLVSGLFGGLDEAEPRRDTARLSLGVLRHADPFDVTIQRVEVTSQASDRHDEPDGRYLVVTARVRSTAPESVAANTLDEMLVLVGLEGLGEKDSTEVRPELEVVGDGSRPSPMTPHLDYDVLFIWDQASSAPAPTSLRLATRDLTYRKSNLDDQMLWTDATIDAEGTFAVQEGSE